MNTIKNQLVFDHKLNRMGELYEEGKDLLFHLQIEDPAHRRMFDVLKEMRDLACVAMQDAYMPDVNATGGSLAFAIGKVFEADPTLEKIYAQDCHGQDGMYMPFFKAVIKRIEQLKNQQ